MRDSVHPDLYCIIAAGDSDTVGRKTSVPLNSEYADVSVLCFRHCTGDYYIRDMLEEFDMNDAVIPNRTDSVETVETDDGVVIQRDERIHTLNVTAREVYELCDGTKSVAVIVEEMVSRYGADERFDSAGIDAHIRKCLDDLSSAGLITIA